MRMTLLEMVQSILSAMDSDEVNSISDTVESLQVANVIKVVYNDIVSKSNLPENYTLFELNASGLITKPILMYLPDTINDLLWVKYDCRQADSDPQAFKDLRFVEVHNFLDLMYGLDSSDPSVQTFSHDIDGSSIDFYFYKDRAPEFYTSFDDKTVVFNSYDSGVDSTLKKNKTLCYGEKVILFNLEDDFTPHLDPRQFSLLYNEAKAMCFAEIKQTQHVRAEKKVREGWITLQRTKENIDKRPAIKKLPHYGRK